MNSLQPDSVEELQEMVKAGRNLLPCGGGSKAALSTPVKEATRLDLSRLSGLLEYEPGEYTLTAYAGTPVREIVAMLAEHGQYLPFDPLLVKQGATLGGTVAANAAGSGRYRYGGVRDFILGVKFVDGYGQVVRSGGKVVKNAAGFDLPKFMVGSLGRYGLLTEISFKVFPAPQAYRSLKVSYANLEGALQSSFRLAGASLDVDALDLEPLTERCFTLLVRFGGLVEALPGRTERLQKFLKAENKPLSIETMEGEAESGLWEQLQACAWVTEGLSLVKVPLSPKQIPFLEMALPATVQARRYSAGGNVAWLATSAIEPLEVVLSELDLAGLLLLGPPGRPIIGRRKGLPLAQRVKQALDPMGKFLGA